MVHVFVSFMLPFPTVAQMMNLSDHCWAYFDSLVCPPGGTNQTDGVASKTAFIDEAKESQLVGDVRLQRRESFQRSPSPIRTAGFEELGRFSDEASTLSAIRDFSQSIVHDPRRNREVSRLQGEHTMDHFVAFVRGAAGIETDKRDGAIESRSVKRTR